MYYSLSAKKTRNEATSSVDFMKYYFCVIGFDVGLSS